MIIKIESHVKQVKARLLPLSIWERRLEWLIEFLPRKLIQVRLNHMKNVEIVNETKGEYLSTSNTPSFELMLTPTPARGGWYYLESTLVRNNGSREACFAINIGKNSNENSLTIPIPTNLRGTVREVFYIPPNTKTLHWIPTAASGFFSQSPLLIHKITALESFYRRSYRVIFDLIRFKNQQVAARAGLTWRGAISNLQNAYERTAALRIKRIKGNDYPAFIALNDTFKSADLQAMSKQLNQMPLLPMLSIIMPVHDPIAKYFRLSIESVLQQIYPHWELLLIGDISSDAECLAIAEECQNKNNQVKIILIKPNAGLASTFNIGLEKSQGEFVLRLNQHDQLPLHSLFLLAQEINQRPEVDLIYTDDDDIDDNQNRLNPRFKPDWNPDLFLSHNYLHNLVLYRKSKVSELGGYCSGFEGAEDYDLSLRFIKNSALTNIRHIPKILYHSRIANLGITEQSHQSGKCALIKHFDKSGIFVEDGAALGLYHIKHPLTVKSPLVSIIIPTRDRLDILKKCIDSVQQKTDYPHWEIIVVDNQSSEPETLAYLKGVVSDARIKVIHYEKPFNYAAINNFAVKYAQGEILALLNNDVEVINDGWLSEMVAHAVRLEIGAVGAKLLYANGMVQHAGVIIGLGGVAGHAHKYLQKNDHGYCHRAVVTQNLSAVTGACLVTRKNCYKEVGGLNEENLKIAFNDIDFCLKLLAAGYKNLFTPHALLYHHESISRGRDDTPEKHELFVREFNYMKNTWGKKLQNDPAYNNNLTLEFVDFSLSARTLA